MVGGEWGCRWIGLVLQDGGGKRGRMGYVRSCTLKVSRRHLPHAREDATVRALAMVCDVWMTEELYMIRQQCWCSGRVPGRRGAGWRWVGLWLEVDPSAPCGRCEDATRAVRSWRDCEEWSWVWLCCVIVQEGGGGLEGQAAVWWWSVKVFQQQQERRWFGHCSRKR